MLETLIIPDEENPLLRKLPEGRFTHANDPDREFGLARYFAAEINSGRLSVRDAYVRYWSYVGDKELWGLENLVDDECRALLPAWQPILLHIASMLDNDKTQELVDIVSENYFNLKIKCGDLNYNPFFDELFFVAKLCGSISIHKKNSLKTIDELYSLLKSQRYDSIFKIDVLTAIVNSRRYKDTLFELWEKNEYMISDSAAKAIFQLGMFKGNIKEKMLSTPFFLDNCTNEMVKCLKPDELYDILINVPESRFALIESIKEQKLFLPEINNLILDEKGNFNWTVAEYLTSFNVLVPELINFLDSENLREKTHAINLLTQLKYKSVLGQIIRVFQEPEDEIRKIDTTKGGYVREFSSLKAAAAHYLGEVGHYHPNLVRRKTERDFSSEEYIREACYSSLCKLGRFDLLEGLYKSSDNFVKHEIVAAFRTVECVPDLIVSLCEDAMSSYEDHLVWQGILTLKHHKLYSVKVETIARSHHSAAMRNEAYACLQVCGKISEQARKEIFTIDGEEQPVCSDLLRDAYVNSLQEFIAILRKRPVDSHHSATKKVMMIDSLLGNKVSSRLIYREAIKSLYPLSGDVWVPFRGQPDYYRVHTFHQRLKPQGYNPPVKKLAI